MTTSPVSLWLSLRTLKGNQRACVVSEPLWAIPFQLFLPFMSLYMADIGLSGAQIGALASLSLAAQFLWGFLSGAIVDRWGRRGTMLCFGLAAWVLPCALWATASGYHHFVLAVLINSLWRVTGNSFSCLIVEGEDTGRLIHIYTILNIISLLAGFLSPLAGLFMERFTLISTMRVLLSISAVLMAVKFIIQYRLAAESSIGRQRMAACRKKSIVALSLGGFPAFAQALKGRRMRLCLSLAVLMTCFNTVQSNFWPLFVKAEYGISDALFSALPTIKSITALLCYLLIVPRLSLLQIKRPLLWAFGAQGAGLLMLIVLAPFGSPAMPAVFAGAACDAFALSMLGPLSESLMSLSIPQDERARINSLIFAAILLISAPIGWLAGQAAEHGRLFPLVINLGLLAAQAAVGLSLSATLSKQGVEASAA